jgi:putative transcriptional regulator
MRCKLKNRLAECRAARGIKKSQLAYRLKMSRAYVTRLERGDIRPSFETAIRIARVFGKPVEEIFQLVEGDGKLSQAACPAKGPGATASESPYKSNFPAVRPSTMGSQLNPTENKQEKVKSL